MTKETTAMFIGHREYYSFSHKSLTKAVEDLIKAGVTDFLSGGDGTFNLTSAICVSFLKKQYPHIRNHLVMPYPAFIIIDGIFDDVIYPDGFVTRSVFTSMLAGNKFMVNNSLYAVCCINRQNCYEYKYYTAAKKNNLRIIDIGDHNR